MRELNPSNAREVTVAAVAFSALLAATTLTAFAIYGLYPPGDVAVARAIQSVRLPGIGALSEALYFSGIFPWLQITWLAFAALLVTLRHRLMAVFLLFGLVAHNFAFLLKEIVERPRPSPLLVDVARAADGFSFPSGHVMSAVLLWGLVFIAAKELVQVGYWRVLLQGFSISMIALMGLQRVYAGAHWPTDVIAAYLWGGLILFALTRALQLLRSRQPVSGALHGGERYASNEAGASSPNSSGAGAAPSQPARIGDVAAFAANQRRRRGPAATG